MLVTNDRADFTALMEREQEHPGLVCVTVAHGLNSLDVQTRLFEHALTRLAGEDLAAESWRLHSVPTARFESTSIHR